MLGQDPEEAKRIILCEKPTISEDQGFLEPALLDRLIENISMLSSVYYKPPEAFVKKIRDRINERLDDEADDLSQGGNDMDYVDSMGVKKSDYMNQGDGNQIIDYNQVIQSDLPDVGDLLGLDDNPGQIVSTSSSLPIVVPSEVMTPNPPPLSLDESLLSFDKNEDEHAYNYLPVPYKPLLDPSAAGQNKTTGLGIQGAFRRVSPNGYQLLLAFTNNTPADLKDMVLKINHNLYGINVLENFPGSLFIPRGTTITTKIKCSILKDNINA